MSSEKVISEQLLESWSTSTWEQMWQNATNHTEFQEAVNEPRFETYLGGLRRNNDYLKIKATAVTGKITEGWKDLNVSGPLFQESLWNVITKNPNSWTPVEYLFDYAIVCKASTKKQKNYDLGRAIRNLPSFMREYFIHSKLIELGIKVDIPGPKENAAGHADLIITYQGQEISMWSFLDTPKSLQMLKTKIQYRTKKFPSLNLLAPFSTTDDTQSIYDWHVPSDLYAETLCNSIKSFEPQKLFEFDNWLAKSDERKRVPFFTINGDELKRFSI
jgi:hypothetical protein